MEATFITEDFEFDSTHPETVMAYFAKIRTITDTDSYFNVQDELDSSYKEGEIDITEFSALVKIAEKRIAEKRIKQARKK